MSAGSTFPLDSLHSDGLISFQLVLVLVCFLFSESFSWFSSLDKTSFLDLFLLKILILFVAFVYMLYL